MPNSLFVNESFLDAHAETVSAIAAIIVSVGIAIVVDRFLIGRAERATLSMDTASFSREARTRLRVIRRLVFLVIIVIGAAIAVSEFTSVKRFATGVLASTAVLGLVIGFAGRQLVANLVAGVLMAITQPVRIGDRVTIGEDEVTGTVKDIALTYTTIERGDGASVVVPNENLISGVVVNHSVGNLTKPLTVKLLTPANADLAAARKAVEELGAGFSVTEMDELGLHLEISERPTPGADRLKAEAELRERAQSALAKAKVLGPDGP